MTDEADVLDAVLMIDSLAEGKGREAFEIYQAALLKARPELLRRLEAVRDWEAGEGPSRWVEQSLEPIWSAAMAELSALATRGNE
jgi:hypothetical protein